MTYHEAKTQLMYALKNQKTIEITRLKELMRVLDINLDTLQPDVERELRLMKDKLNKLSKQVDQLESKA